MLIPWRVLKFQGDQRPNHPSLAFKEPDCGTKFPLERPWYKLQSDMTGPIERLCLERKTTTLMYEVIFDILCCKQILFGEMMKLGRKL